MKTMVSIKKKMTFFTTAFIAVLFACIILIITIMSIITEQENSEKVKESIEHTVLDLGNALTGNSAVPLMVQENSFSALKNLIFHTLVNEDDVIQGAYLEKNGQTWVSIVREDGDIRSNNSEQSTNSITAWFLQESEYSYRHSDNSAFSNIECASPVLINDTIHGYLFFEISSESIKHSIEILHRTSRKSQMRTMIILIFIGGFAVFIAYLFINRFSDYITHPIDDLLSSVKLITSGDYTKSIAAVSNDEIGRLAIEFNTMRLEIQESTETLQVTNSQLLNKEAELSELNIHLEEKVTERTKEVEESLARLKQAQGQLVEAEKMASLGGLVAGVAHEINTPVGIGVTAASHIRKKSRDFQEKYNSGKLSRKDFESFVVGTVENSEIILSNMERAAELIQSFKQVAVDQTTEDIRDFEMGQYIQELLASLHPKLKKTQHHIDVNIKEKIFVKTVAGAVSQVFTNLIMNSLIHGFENLERGVISITITTENTNVKVEYRDNGCGIPIENIGKVFDPFFTTKRGMGGTGLGMHILFNLITQKLQGQVRCNDTDEAGAFFEILFPCEL